MSNYGYEEYISDEVPTYTTKEWETWVTEIKESV